MSSVFLSYSREDLPLIEELEAQLQKHSEISIWRDQEKLYGGQKWPKILGEVIADHDFFLLAWSKHSANSHFVEFEWCTALALKKTIIPCLLDDTKLPPSLAATHAIPAEYIGVPSRNPGKFRHPKFSPARSASRMVKLGIPHLTTSRRRGQE